MSTIEINDTIEISDLEQLVANAFEIIDNSGEFGQEEFEDAVEDIEIVGDVLAQFGFNRADSRKFESQLAELGTPPKPTVFIEENYFEEHVLENLREAGITEDSNSSWFTEFGALNVDFAKSHYKNVDIDGNSYYIGK